MKMRPDPITFELSLDVEEALVRVAVLKVDATVLVDEYAVEEYLVH